MQFRRWQTIGLVMSLILTSSAGMAQSSPPNSSPPPSRPEPPVVTPEESPAPSALPASEGPAPLVSVAASPAPTADVKSPRADEEAARFRTHADKVGWNKKHPVGIENIYYKPGNGLTVESDDHLFKLETRVRGQFYYALEKADDEDPSQTVSIRRARVVFGGHVFGEDNVFKMELALSPQDLGMSPDLVDFDNDGEEDSALEDANPITDNSQRLSRSPLLDLYVQFRQLRDLNVRVGQYKIPFSRQRVISSGDLMFVDRSIVNGEFNLDRDIGFDLRSENLFGWKDRLRYYVGVYAGEGHSSFNARDLSSTDHFFGLNTLVRLEYLPFGKFKDYSESDLERTEKPGLSLGATFAFIGNAKGSRGILGRQYRDAGTTDFLLGEADAMFKYRGLSMQLEFMVREGKRNADGASAPEPSRSGWGLSGQAGYLTPINVEIAVRHSAVRGMGRTSLQDGNETGLGLSYYLAGHPYKLQADYFRLYRDSISDGEHAFRAQLQVSL